MYENPQSYASYGPDPAAAVRFVDHFVTGGYVVNTATLSGKFSETANQGEWLVLPSVKNTETITILDSAKGGVLNMLTSGADNAYITIQVNGEAFQMDTGLTYSTRLSLTDVSETDFMAGIGISDTDPLGSITTTGASSGITDFVGFFCPDSSGNIYAICITGTAAGSYTVIDTGVDLADDTMKELAFQFNQTTGAVTFYIDGANVGTISTTIPTDQTVSPIFQVRVDNAGNAAQTMKIDYVDVSNIVA